MKYHVRDPLSAVLKEPAGSIAFLTIDACSVITVKGEVGAYGFVEANYGGDDILVFCETWNFERTVYKGRRLKGTSLRSTIGLEEAWNDKPAP